MQHLYPLSVGEADYQRLHLLNRVYNPRTQEFILAAGLPNKISILEIGCGTGDMAIWLAQQFPLAKVLAVDMNLEQLSIAKESAQQANISNIEFQVLNIADLATLQQSFDVIYGRWVLEYIENPQSIIQSIYNALNPNGMMIYGALSFLDTGFFCSPHSDLIMEWMNVTRPKVLPEVLDRDLNKHIYHIFKRAGYANIQVLIDQPFLITAEERSLLRMGLISMHDQLLRRNIMTEEQHKNLVAEFARLEHEDMIFGNHRNLLIRGTKR